MQQIPAQILVRLQEFLYPYLHEILFEFICIVSSSLARYGTLDSFMWGSYPASLQNFGGSSQLPACACINTRRDTWGLPPSVKWESLKKSLQHCCSIKLNQTKKLICYVIYFVVPPTIRRGPQSTEVTEGEDVQFTCQISGTPYPVTTIIWQKDNHYIKLVIQFF